MNLGLYGERERRRHPRSLIPFDVTVTGAYADGNGIDDVGILRDISQGGVCLRLPHRAEPGAGIMCLIRFSEVPAGGPQIPVRGRVTRSEMHAIGVYDLAVEFTRPLLEEHTNAAPPSRLIPFLDLKPPARPPATTHTAVRLACAV
jgi:hypothetical protein